MTFEQQWIEYDYYPFILYNQAGKIVSLNSEAQYLLGAVNQSVLFEIATTYASASFGFKTTFFDLEFGRYKFFGITVGYEHENEIGIRFYQQPTFNKFAKPKPMGNLVNVYTLIDLCVSTNSIGSSVTFKKEFDPTIPDIRLHADLFIKLLNKIFSSMKDNDIIFTKLYFRVGEHIVYEDVKYTFFSIEIKSENIDKKRISEIELLAEGNSLFIEIKKYMLTINIPMIMD